MFVAVAELRSQAGQLADQLDPNALVPADAARVFELLAEIEKLVSGARLRLAARAAGADTWRAAGERSAAHWVARRCGISLHRATEMLRTASQLPALSATDEAVRQGRLSPAQASEVADASTDAPGAEQRLLESAARDGWAGLRDTAKAVKAAACPDPDAQLRRAHARRRFTSHTEGAEWIAHIHTSVDQGARIDALLRPHVEAEFRAARREGRRESLDAYRVDALERMGHEAAGGSTDSDAAANRAAGEPGDTSTRRPRVKTELVLLASLSALQRGHLEQGEVCEIDGVGPVPLAVARDALGDAALSIVLTDGVDVRNVTRHSRHWSPEQRTALLVRDRHCVVEGCTYRGPLEIHHEPGYDHTHHSRVDEAARLCPPDHDRVTNQGYELIRTPRGTWVLLSPEQVAARRGTAPPRRDTHDERPTAPSDRASRANDRSPPEADAEAA
jgi:hypothetical protein